MNGQTSPIFLLSRIFLAFAALAALMLAWQPASAQTSDYRVAPGDVLLVTVYGDTQLSGSFPVSPDGSIGYPVLGNIPVSGKTVTEIGDRIGNDLKEHIANLSVAVAVKEYAPVFVLGEVQRPGKYEFRPGMIVLELFALSGGLREKTTQGDIPGMQMVALRQEYEDIGLQIFGQEVKRARLEAEMNDEPFEYVFDPGSSRQDPAAARRVIDSERKLYDQRLSALEAEKRSLERQRHGFIEEIATLEKSGKLRDEEVALLNEDVTAAKSLVDRGLTAKTQLREKQRELSATNRDALEFGSFLARARQNLAEIEGRLLTLQDQRRNDAARDIREIDLDTLRLRRKMAFVVQSMAELGIAVQRAAEADQELTVRFSAIRLVDGAYRETAIAEYEPIKAGDIVRVTLFLADKVVAQRNVN
ncbi:MAG: polysaccharide biosynthesis/export family protein [Shinella sp.]|jgi:polysaccharide biosynthesis/export protein|nr:polysaccharide biosynthesis/export family protein [Shinella sp.]